MFAIKRIGEEKTILLIRYADKDDSFNLGYIHSNSWKSTYKNIIPEEVLRGITVEKRQKYFDNVLRNNMEENVIVEKDNSIAGFMTFGKCRDNDKDNTHGEIWGIYLLEEFWHQGIGKELINWGLRKLSDRGYTKVCLWVLQENKQAIRFYEGQGFRFDNTSKEINIGKPLIELRYIKELDKG